MARHFHVFALDRANNGDPYTRTFIVRRGEEALREVNREIESGRHTTTLEPCDNGSCLGPEPPLFCRGHRSERCQSGAADPWKVA